MALANGTGTPTEVRTLVDKAELGAFYLGITSLQADRSIFGTLVERWWDTTNSFHFWSAKDMTVTSYDFSIVTGLSVGGDLIPFNLDLSRWPTAQMFLLGVVLSFTRHGMIRYNWLLQHFHGLELVTLEEVAQYARGFLLYVLGTTLFANRDNTIGLYLLSNMVELERVREDD